MLRSIFILACFIFSLYAQETSVKYTKFLDEQIKLTYALNDENNTQQKLAQLVQEQQKMYENALYQLMANKEYYLKNLPDFTEEIFGLKKRVAINKRLGNDYAVTRDEVQIKSYLIAQDILSMIKNILGSLQQSKSIHDFIQKLNFYTAKNQKEIQAITKQSDYSQILNLPDNSDVLASAKKNIQELYALEEIDNDMISYVYKFSHKMYALNKYARYHLIKPVVYINSLKVVHIINKELAPLGLSVVKLSIFLFLLLVIYLFRKLFYFILQRYLISNQYLNEYAEDILLKTKRTIEFLIVVINVDMIIYVYNDFSNNLLISQIFNVVYVMILTYFVYVVVNTIAALNLQKFQKSVSSVKAELINVGIKIINFFIFTIGLLLVLYFAGVNLTAVLSGLGIGGFAVAFAAKDTISNFFGTLSILFSDIFSQGDWIEIDGKEGTVVEIGLRVTTIRTFDNALIAIPNGTFASKDIKNWNKRKLGRRIKMKLGVKYDSKIEDINKAVIAIREMLKNHPDIATQETKYEHIKRKDGRVAKLVSKDDLEGVKRTLLVYLDDFSDSSIDILVYCYSKSVKWEEWLQVKQDVMEKIMKIFEENHLEFAFPSLSIYNETTS